MTRPTVADKDLRERLLRVEFITARSAIDARLALADERATRGVIVLHSVYVLVHGDQSEWVDRHDVYLDGRLCVAGLLDRDEAVAYLGTLGVDVSDGTKVKGDYGYPRWRRRAS